MTVFPSTLVLSDLGRDRKEGESRGGTSDTGMRVRVKGDIGVIDREICYGGNDNLLTMMNKRVGHGVGDGGI